MILLYNQEDCFHVADQDDEWIVAWRHLHTNKYEVHINIKICVTLSMSTFEPNFYMYARQGWI